MYVTCPQQPIKFHVNTSTWCGRLRSPSAVGEYIPWATTVAVSMLRVKIDYTRFENSRYSILANILVLSEIRMAIEGQSSSRYVLEFSSNEMWAVLYNKIQFLWSLTSLFPLLSSLLSSRLNCSFRQPAQWERDLEQVHLTCSIVTHQLHSLNFIL